MSASVFAVRPTIRVIMDSPSLVAMNYELFSLGSVRPNGWFRDQLRLCGHGLGGNMLHFYRFVKRSTWLGGTWEYTALNEAAPYWYNFVVPLAYGLDEQSDGEAVAELKNQAVQFLTYTLAHQSDDGWIGPEGTRQTRGIWARCLLLQGMMNHALADPSKRPAILEAILKFVNLVHEMLENDFEGYLPKDGDQFDLQWFGVARAHELSTTLQWLYDEPEAYGHRKTIWDVMEMLWTGSRIAKRDWTVFFAEENFPHVPSVKHKSLNFQHGVNVAQGLCHLDIHFRSRLTSCQVCDTRPSFTACTRLQSCPSYQDEPFQGPSPFTARRQVLSAVTSTLEGSLHNADPNCAARWNSFFL